MHQGILQAVRYQRRLQADEPILAWLVRHARNVINRGPVPFEQRRVDKRWSKSCVLFGGTCFFSSPQQAMRQKDGENCECKEGILVTPKEKVPR